MDVLEWDISQTSTNAYLIGPSDCPLTNHTWDQCIHWRMFTHGTRSCARLDDEREGFVKEAVEC